MRPRHVGEVAAGDHHVAHGRGALEVVEHLLLPVGRPQHQPGLGDLGGGGADEVHPGAVPAVLRAGGDQFGQHLGRVAVGEALDHPHLGLVQRVAFGLRVAGPQRVPVGEHRQHVSAHRVGQERGGERRRGGGGVRGHGVQQLRRQQDRHGRELGLVGGELLVELGGEQIADDGPELAGVLDAVRALPLGVAPLRLGDVAPAGQSAPVRLHQPGADVLVRLRGRGGCRRCRCRRWRW